MKPLIVLLLVFLVALIFKRLIDCNYDFALPGKIAMAAMLVFTAVGHFVFTKGMTMMLPEFIPYKTATVYLTGIIEITFAVGLLIPANSVITGWFLIAFFILILPANIYAAVKQVDYQKGTFEGKGLNYLWFRVPLQILFIAWVYLSAVKG